MLERLRSYFKKVDESGAAQTQREAMVDLLLWTMYVDKRLSLPESEKIDQVAESLTWTSTTPMSQYLSLSTSKVRDILADEDKSDQFLDDIYRRLGSDEMRYQAYDACCDLAQADGEVAQAEEQFLTTLKTKFGVSQS